jgi:cyclopropane fatty-acyl-phospholipid synthase-like methyltransferase
MTAEHADTPKPGDDADRSQRSVGFESAYAGTPPWDIGRPQPAFLRLADAGALQGRVLDAGCGTGEHALLAAGLGLPATGIDAAPTAIALAERKAQQRNLTARFIRWDALELASLGEQFDTVIDCGLFHVFDDHDRSRYVASLSAAIVPGGRYHMLCFSDQQQGDQGPRRVRQNEIRSSFASGWSVESIEAAILAINTGTDGILAWLSTIVRV